MVKKRNAYWYFMKEYQEEEREQGRFVDMGEAANVCGQRWCELSPEQKKTYEDRAKAFNEGRNQPKSFKKFDWDQQSTSSRVSSKRQLEELEQVNEDELHEDLSEHMMRTVMDSIQGEDDLLNTPFFVMASNILVMTDDRQYLPNELGLVKFSIRDGIQDKFHFFIDPGNVPLGYARLAKEHMETSHKIPMHGFTLASKNYQHVTDMMMEWLMESRIFNRMTGAPTCQLVLTPKFDLDDMTDQNRGVLKWLKNKYREKDASFNWEIEVLDLIELAQKISSRQNQPVPVALIEDRLKSVIYDYTPGINCEALHDEQENRFCALGVALRWAYLFLDLVLPMLNINPGPNHLPKKPNSSVSETYYPVYRNVDKFPKKMPPAPRQVMGALQADRNQEAKAEEKPEEKQEGASSERYFSPGLAAAASAWAATASPDVGMEESGKELPTKSERSAAFKVRRPKSDIPLSSGWAQAVRQQPSPQQSIASPTPSIASSTGRLTDDDIRRLIGSRGRGRGVPQL